MILYHGSSSNFNDFKVDYLKSFSEGYGLYTTFSPNYALTYCHNNLVNYIYEINIKDEFIIDETEKKIKLKDWKKCFDFINQSLNYPFSIKDFKIKNNDFQQLNYFINLFQTQLKLSDCLNYFFNFMIKHKIYGVKIQQKHRQCVNHFVLCFKLDNIIQSKKIII